MSGNGGVFKRCGCRDTQTGRMLDSRCPRLGERGHGSWYFDCAVTQPSGRRGRVRRGGYATRRDAVAARDALLHTEADDPGSGSWTVARWLRYWLTTGTSIRASTLRSYTHHVETYLIPHLGRRWLGELTNGHVTAMFQTLAETDTRRGTPATPGTLHRVHATVRAALNAAIRVGLRTDNPARHVELSGPRRPHAQVWTDQQVAGWREHGQRPVVGVWTPQQLTTFFDSVAADRLRVLWWLIALLGLRRGEAAGLRWCDIDLDAATLTVAQQRIAYGRIVAAGPPKTAASRRTISLDHATVRLLREHHRRQQAERLTAGDRWSETGYVFTAPDGQPLHPDYLTRRFRRLVTLSGLPPVRLHDLRHGAASLALAAGTDLKVVQAMLGHASIVLAADTYTSVLPELLAASAEATARLVLATAARNPARRSPQRLPAMQKSAAATPGRLPKAKRPKRSRRRRGQLRRGPHAFHVRPTKIQAI